MAFFAAIAIVVVVGGLLAYTPIERGRVGVIVRFGKVQPGILQPGLHWRTPFIDGVLKYRTEKITYETSYTPEESQADYTDYCVDTSSSDGQQVTICYTVRISVIPERAEWIANTFWDEGRLVERVVKTDSRGWARAIPRRYTAEQLYTGDIVIVQDEIQSVLTPLYEANGVLLDQVVIREVHFSDEYVTAVEAKQIAEQTVITRQHEAEQAKFEAERQVNLAEGQASARRIQAEAEAFAIQQQGEVLRQFPEVIQWQFVESLTDPNGKVRWGILPSNSGVVPFLQLPADVEGTTPSGQ